MSTWGPWCEKCGHPASYHTMTACVHDSGSTRKKVCDCSGYQPHGSAGKCTAVMPGIAGDRPFGCTLTAGHEGMHHDADGADWMQSPARLQGDNDVCACGHGWNNHKGPETPWSDMPCRYCSCQNIHDSIRTEAKA